MAAGGIDGRTARSVRTKAAIVDACLALVAAGDLRPTAPRVAEKAGVSVRSVFQHFADLESLFATVGDEALRRFRARAMDVDPDLPLDERVAAAVEQRSALLEDLTPLRRSVAVNATDSPSAIERMRLAHSVFRVEVSRVFANELDGDSVLLDAVDGVMSWPLWDQLRTLIGLEQPDARVVLERIVLSLLRPGAE